MQLVTGDVVEFIDSTSCVITSYIGGGGQGKVFKVLYNNNTYALKIYNPAICNSKKGLALRNNILHNIDLGVLSDHFIWPLKLTKALSDGSFGYLMKLIPNEYMSFSSFITKLKRGFVFFDYYFNGAIVTACRIAFEYRKLWRKGLCFQDLNEGSIFINPKTWDVLICDCDNVAADRTEIFVQGMPGYMSPEVYVGKETPNYYSDLHSLGVIVFMLLFGGAHPFYGKEARRLSFEDPKSCALKTYGDKAIYIMDKDNTLNRPQPGIDNLFIMLFPLYPDYVKDLFQQMFVEGVKNPKNRPNDKNILNMLGRLYSDLVQCYKCEKPVFLSAYSKSEPTCYNCHAPLNNFLFLKNEYNTIAVDKYKRLYRWQLTGEFPSEDNAFDITGVMEKCPDNRYKLINNSSEAWTLELGEQKRQVNPGKSVYLVDALDMKIYIYNSCIIIKKR